jgi:HD-like signal output (HDOD) protein
MTPARELVRRVTGLPTLPAVYFRVRSVIEQPDSFALDIAREISCDPGLTMRLLRVANGAYYGLPRKVESIMDAIAIIGANQILNLVLATSITMAFDGVAPPLMNMRKFWRTSLYRALVARCLAKQSRHNDAERAFVEGLVGDIGHLVMYMQMPEVAEQALQRSIQTASPVHRIEREMLGFDYGELGAELVTGWNISPRIEAALRYHTEPLHAEDAVAEASALHIATRFASAAFMSESPARWVPQIDPRVWQEAGVSLACIAGIKQEADRELEALALAILPGFATGRHAKSEPAATSAAQVP